MQTDPFAQLSAWLAEAEAGEPNDANAMTLATATADGVPAARMVLLKGIDGPAHNPRGLVFYTNLQSRKGEELAANPRAALLFHWKSLRRQIRADGPVEPVTPAEADAYFASRARVSRLGANASDQSRPLPSREVLERRVAELDARYPADTVPRPAYWSGFRLVPRHFEFWRDMPYRLHERIVFTREGDGWRTGMLYP